MINKSRNLILVTFDIPKPDYPSISYSIASIIATLNKYKVSFSHYTINIQQTLETVEYKNSITKAVKSQISDAITFFKKFDHIAIGVTRWSIEHTRTLLGLLDDYHGKIILGGYEITAIDEADLLAEFSTVDYFIKGYAEKALIKILNNECSSNGKVVFEDLDPDFLFSPYQQDVLNTYSRKVYWETKRGCEFKCGFCEWGNIKTGSIPINADTIDNDIALFSRSNIDEINILDGTFNVGENYFQILENLLNKTDSVLTFQARFEALTDEFIKLCSNYKERVHLEFGLQSIHEKELQVIGRKNNLAKITQNLHKLNESGLAFKVSIIYAIPSQTVESFIDTVEFLLLNGCKEIRAFALQVPRNSSIYKQREAYQITFHTDKFNVKTVMSSLSFTPDNRSDMDRIAAKLNNDMLTERVQIDKKHLNKAANTIYQYEIDSLFIKKNMHLFRDYINNDFVSQTRDDLWNRYNSMDAITILGSLVNQDDSTLYEYATCQKPLKFTNQFTRSIEFKGQQIQFNRQENLKATNFFCKIRLGESGALYIFRETEIVE